MRHCHIIYDKIGEKYLTLRIQYVKINSNNKILHIFEGRKFELALFDKNDVAIAAATIFGGGFKTYVDDKQTEEIFVVQAIELK